MSACQWTITPSCATEEGVSRMNTNCLLSGKTSNCGDARELDARRTSRPAKEFQSGVRVVVREDAATGAERVDAEVVEVVDRDDANLQHVAGLRAFDENGTAHWVCARAALGDALLHRFQRLGDVRLRHSRQAKPLQSTGDHRLDADAISRRDAQRGRDLRIVVAPVDGFGPERQVVHARRLRANSRAGDARQQNHRNRQSSRHFNPLTTW